MPDPLFPGGRLMRTWLLLLAGPLVWTAHFFAAYITASIFPGTALARWLTGLLTVGALALLGIVILQACRSAAPVREAGSLPDWLASLTRLGAALAAIAVLYQALPALLA